MEGEFIVPRRGGHVEAEPGEASESFTPRQAVRRALKAAHPKALEDRAVCQRARITCLVHGGSHSHNHILVKWPKFNRFRFTGFI